MTWTFASISEDDSNIISKTKTLLDDSVKINNFDDSDSPFSLGIVLGLIIGATISVVFIFIIRLKHEEKLNKVY